MIDMIKELFGKRTSAKSPRSAFCASVFSILFAAVLAVSPASVFADTNPANDSDSITMTIVPVVDIGVSIDTTSVVLNFTLPMGATDFTLNPANLTILGNVQAQEIDVQATNVSANPVWTADTDETAGIDEVQVYALFSVGRGANPSLAEFAGVKNLVTPTLKRAGGSPGAGPDLNFENNSMTGGVDMDNMLVGDTRQMWLRIDAPPLTTTGDVQKIQITVNATRTAL
jgi:hypothetical protein